MKAKLIAILAVFSTVTYCGKKYDNQLTVKSVGASSGLRMTENPGDYYPMYVVDGRGDTSWCEGAQNEGVNEELVITLQNPIKFNTIYLQNGYNSKIMTKTKDKAGKESIAYDEKTSLKNFNEESIPSAFIVTTFFTDKNGQTKKSNEVTVTLPEADLKKPEVVLNTPELLKGDVIRIKIKDVYQVGRTTYKNTSCITDLAFGNSEKDGIKRYPHMFVDRNQNVKSWDAIYDKLKEEFQDLKNNYYYYQCLAASEPRCESSGLKRSVVDMASGPINIYQAGAAVNGFYFNWSEQESSAPAQANGFFIQGSARQYVQLKIRSNDPSGISFDAENVGQATGGTDGGYGGNTDYLNPGTINVRVFDNAALTESNLSHATLQKLMNDPSAESYAWHKLVAVSYPGGPTTHFIISKAK